MPKLIIKRNTKDLFLSKREIEIFIDEKKVGYVSLKNDFLIEVDKGEHYITFKLDFIKSERILINVSTNKTVLNLSFFKSMLFNKKVFYTLNIILFLSLPFLPKYENINIYSKVAFLLILGYFGISLLEFFYYSIFRMENFFKVNQQNNVAYKK